MTETEGPVDDRTNIDPQLLYDRSRASAFDLLKLLVTLATGGVALYFSMITGETKLSLSTDERVTGLLGFACMTAAVFAGLIGWAADACFYERWAQSLQHESRKGDRWRSRHKSNKVRRLALAAAIFFFVLGLLVSGVFAYKRAWGATKCGDGQSAVTPGVPSSRRVTESGVRSQVAPDQSCKRTPDGAA